MTDALAPALAPSPADRPARPWLAPLLLVVLNLLAYLPAYDAGFIWDDDDYIYNNPVLRSTQGLVDLWLRPTSIPQYYPLVHTTYWIEYRLWGTWAPGYHTVNIVLHALGAWLLWRLLGRLGLPAGAAWLGAALWSLHPVQVESVAWVTERKNTLSAVFYFSAALLLLRWDDGRKLRWLAGAFGLFALALASKTVTSSLPAAFLLVAVYWRRGRITWRDIWPTVPFFALGLAAGMLTKFLERTHVGAVGPEWDHTFAERVLIAGRAAWFYLYKLALPVDLAFIYPRWQVSVASLAHWALPVTMLGLLIVLFALRGRLGRGPFVALAFFLGTVFPALGFVDVYPHRYSFVADHFQHLACLGPLALLAVGLTRVPATAIKPARVAAGAIVSLCFVLTFLQSRIYEDKLTLWTDTAIKTPGSWMVHVNLGKAHDQLARTAPSPEQRAFHEQQAYEAMTKAARVAGDGIGSGIAEARWNAGVAHSNRREFARAEVLFRRSLEADPKYVAAINSYGMLLRRTGREAEAFPMFVRAVELQPGFPSAQANLAEGYLAQGEFESAARHFAGAASLEPAVVRHRVSLARTVARLALTKESPAERAALLEAAAGHYELARRLDPGGARTLFEMSHVMTLIGRADIAEQLMTQALSRDPSLRTAPNPLAMPTTRP